MTEAVQKQLQADSKEVLAVPTYTFSSLDQRISVIFKNLTCRQVVLKKGTAIANMTVANVIPPNLAPKTDKSNVNTEETKQQEKNEPKPLNPDQLKKLFEKLNLSGNKEWMESQRQSVHDLIVEV